VPKLRPCLESLRTIVTAERCADGVRSGVGAREFGECYMSPRSARCGAIRCCAPSICICARLESRSRSHWSPPRASSSPSSTRSLRPTPHGDCHAPPHSKSIIRATTQTPLVGCADDASSLTSNTVALRQGVWQLADSPARRPKSSRVRGFARSQGYRRISALRDYGQSSRTPLRARKPRYPSRANFYR
jgi:hypothetical protein